MFSYATTSHIHNIHHNTFRAPELPVKIRGVPQEKADVHHNWFLRHRDPASAVRAKEKTNVFNNAYGSDPAKVVK